jgi:hypothetical protein
VNAKLEPYVFPTMVSQVQFSQTTMLIKDILLDKEISKVVYI